MYLAILLGLASVVVVLRFLAVRGRLSRYDPSLSAPLPPTLGIDGVEAYLQERDDRNAPIKPGCGSSVRWAPGAQGKQIDTVVIFMHGFSASPRECEPVDVKVAEELGAHLLRYRLSAHGYEGDLERAGMALRDDAGRDAYLHDMAVAFALGKLLGRRVIILGCSTGGTLAVWLAAQPWAQADIHALVLFSPAFAIAKVGTTVYNLLKWVLLLLPRTGGTAILHAINGPINRVPYMNEIQNEIWTMAYPTESISPLLEMYVSVEVAVPMARVRCPTLAFGNPADRVVDFHWMGRNLKQMPHGEIEVLTTSEMAHNLTGPLSPSTIPFCIARSADFVRAALKATAGGGAGSGS